MQLKSDAQSYYPWAQVEHWRQEIGAQLRGEVVFVGVHCRRTRAVNEPSQCFVMPRENPYKALLLFESTY